MIRLSLSLGTLLSSIALGAALTSHPVPTSAEEKLVPPSKATRTQVGLASYYSRRLDGKKTANGERFSNEELVAAHRTYPLGTRVRVTNLQNGKSVVVRINDRGASAQNHREGVIIDLSQAAASQLQMKHDGRVRVRVSVLEWGEEDHPAIVEVRENG